MIRRLLLWSVFLLSAGAGVTLAQQRTPEPTDLAENRTALVIGNSNYKGAPLANPLNDARAIAKALGESGFQVKLRANLTQSQMRQAIREFGDELQARQGVGLFYFAGHGVQISNRNFLIPVGADIQREYEVEDRAVDASAVLAMMESAKARVNIVILDACRNNPFIRNFRSTINGLAPMQAPAGTLVAFSTAPGQTAIDGTGQFGLYTEHLVENLRVPGLKIEDVFKNVRVGVQRASDGKQVPWENTSLTGDFYFKAGAAPARQVQQEDIDHAVQAALRKREEEEAARRAAQQGEIERAVLAALKKREDEQAAAQAAKAVKDTAEAKAAVERLNKELVELRAAQVPAPQQLAAASPPSASPVVPEGPAAQAAIPTPQQATKPPVQVAIAAPTSARQKAPITVGGRVERPDIRVGDQWKYQVTDRYTDFKSTVLMEVATVTGNLIYTQSAQVSTDSADLTAAAGTVDVWDRDWNHIRHGPIEYAPLYPNAKFPMGAGSTWSGSVRFDTGGGVTLAHDVAAQVAGWERITVPAGTFDAVRIDLHGYFHILGGSVNGSIVDTYWYAPSARQFVKKEIDHRTGSNNFASYSSNPLTSYQQYERWELVKYKAD